MTPRILIPFCVLFHFVNSMPSIEDGTLTSIGNLSAIEKGDMDISPSNNPVFIIEGNQLRLYCKFKNLTTAWYEQSDTSEWYKSDKAHGNNFREELMTTDSKYKCQEDGTDATLSWLFDVQVLSKPILRSKHLLEPILNDASSPGIDIKQYGILEISCSIKTQHNVTLSWKRNNRVISNEDGPKLIDSAHGRLLTSRLVFDSIRLEDGGQYNCIVASALNEDEPVFDQSVRITVQEYIPNHPEVQTLHFEAGQTFTLTCGAQGVDKKTIWLHQSHNSKWILFERGNQLTISDASHENDGIYKCNSSGPYFETTFEIHILPKSEIFFQTNVSDEVTTFFETPIVYQAKCDVLAIRGNKAIVFIMLTVLTTLLY